MSKFRTLSTLGGAIIVAVLCAGLRPDPTAAQSRCIERTLVGRHAYSICEADKHWHVVTDSYYCIPHDGIETKRTYDKKTEQECNPKKPAQAFDLFGLKFLLQALRPLDSSCQAPKPAGEISVFECVANFWELATYTMYECLDGSLRRQPPPTHIVRTTTSCEQPPPKATDLLEATKGHE